MGSTRATTSRRRRAEEELAAAASLAAAPDCPIERALEAARELLGMEMAYVADTRRATQTYVAIAGDGDSFQAQVGGAVPLEDTYCGELLAGRLDGVVTDARHDPRVRDLAITDHAGIGAYLGMPLKLSDGTVFGTLCCVSHDPHPELAARDAQFLALVARLVAAQLERQETAEARHREEMINGAVRALLAALAARDGYTEEHSAAVVDLARDVGHRLGLTGDELADLENVALLHDIGKIGVPDAILRKPGALDDAEWAVMRTHPVIAADVVASMPALAHLASAVRAEHERWDGGGYPDGLAGEDSPLHSRIVFVCDALHAMTSDRPYRAAMTYPDAVAELQRGSGTQFCPEAVDAAVRAIATRYPTELLSGSRGARGGSRRSGPPA